MTPAIRCRPIANWSGDFTTRRRRSQFSAGWSDTLRLLTAELAHLGAHSVILELDIDDSDLRNDGWPRAAAKVSPPIRLSFGSRHGPLAYAADRFDYWQDNVRAIALALEALRKVDRYGVSAGGEQYAGWAALPSAGDGPADGPMDVLVRLSGLQRDEAVRLPLDRLIRRARAQTHPDAGGTAEDFDAVRLAAEALEDQ